MIQNILKDKKNSTNMTAAKKKSGAKGRRAARKVKGPANQAKASPPGSARDADKVKALLVQKDLIPSPPMSEMEEETKVVVSSSGTLPKNNDDDVEIHTCPGDFMQNDDDVEVRVLCAHQNSHDRMYARDHAK